MSTLSKIISYLNNKLSLPFLILGLFLIFLFTNAGTSKVINLKPVGLLQGHAYASPLNIDQSKLFTTRPDTEQKPGRSSAILLEDGVPLLKPHTSIHKNIIDDGAGRYSHWKGIVYFSSSDNTDPSKNGREYKLIYKIYPTPFFIITLTILLITISLLIRKFEIFTLLSQLVRNIFSIKNDWIFCLFCIFGMIVVMLMQTEFLFPNFNQLNSWDEVTYIGSGRHLIEEGTLWPYSRGPLISLIYSIAYYPALLTDNWLLASSIIGRLINFIFTWMGLCSIATVLHEKKLANRYIFLIVSVMFPVFVQNLVNPSYALFTTVSIWAVYFLLKAKSSDQSKNILLASLFISLGGLTRPEIFFTLPIFVFLSIIVTNSLNPVKRIQVLLTAIAIPISLICGYILIYFFATGQFVFGSGDKLYLTFEASEILMMESNGKDVSNWLGSAQEQARQLYGTPEDNNYSVFRAILNNPNAYLQRELVNLERAYSMFILSYGHGNAWLGFAVLSLSIFGLAVLIYQRMAYYALIYLFWPLHLTVYLATIIFPAYLILPFFCVISLVSIGITTIVKNFKSNIPNVLFIDEIKSLFDRVSCHHRRHFRQLFFTVIISILIISASIIVNNIQNDKSNEFLTADFLSSKFQSGTKILTYPGISVELAKMKWVGFSPDLVAKLNSEINALTFFNEQGISGVIIEPSLVTQDPFSIWKAMSKWIDNGTFILIYSSDDGKHKIYIPNIK